MQQPDKMTDKPVPPPALSSEALDKSRRNTLVWSALVVASELAQNTKHEIKSSAIGSDTALPVSMVSIIFLFLAAFHLYAFWEEKKRIVRWRSKYATEHPGVSLREKITALYEQLPALLLRVSESKKATVRALVDIEKTIDHIEHQSEAIESYYKACAHRDREMAEAMKTARHVDDNGPQAVMSKFFHLNKGRPEGPQFEMLRLSANQLPVLLDREMGPDDELRAKLDKVTKDLTTLADDIDVGERRYFYWYEVGAPVAAFAIAAAFWAGSAYSPNLPLGVRALF